MASRIAFALADLRAEIQNLIADPAAREAATLDICMAPPIFELVEREIADRHNGAKLPEDRKYRGPGTRAIRYAGVRLVMMPVR